MAPSPKAMQKIIPKSPIVTEHVGSVILPLVSGMFDGSNPPVLAKYGDNGSGSTGLYTPQFPTGEAELSMYLNGALPEDYVPGSDLYVELTWAPGDNSAGDVVFGLEYGVVNSDGIGEETSIVETVLSMPEVSGQCDRTLLVTIPGAGFEPGALMGFRLYRDPADENDDYAEGMFGFTLEVKYNSTFTGLKRKYLDLA